jgi:DNA-binding beta-propeller fold protein YncE
MIVMKPVSHRRWCLFLVALVVSMTTVARSQIFVASQQTQEILQYDALDGSFEGVFASAVTEGFRTPGGLALRSSDGVLFVSSLATGEVWSYSTQTGTPHLPVIAGGLLAPLGIALDAAGTHLYVADSSDSEADSTNTVKEIDIATGIVTVMGTNNQADFVGTRVRDSDVYVTDVALGRILRFPIAGGPSSVEISGGLTEPTALLFPSANTLLIADTGGDRVVEYSDVGGSWVFVREVLSPTDGIGSPRGLAIAPDGRLTVTSRDSGEVVLVDLGTLVVSPLVAPGAGGLTDPVDVTWHGQELQVASRGGNVVVYFDSLGQPTGVRAEGLSAPLDAGIELSADGSRLFVASIGANDIVEYDRATGGRIRTFNQACPNLPLPFDLVLDPGGDLYVSCTLNSSIERFDGALGTSLGSFVLAGAGGLMSPRSLAFGPNGNLFVADGTGAVLEFDGTTGAPIGPGPFIDANANGGGALDARGLTFRAGVLYVASFLTDEVMAFDASTGAYLSTFVAAGAGGLDGPTACAFGPDDDLYVASQGHDSIRRYSGTTGSFVETFVAAGSGGLDSPFDLVFHATSAPAVPALDPMLRFAVAALLVTALFRRSWQHRPNQRMVH